MITFELGIGVKYQLVVDMMLRGVPLRIACKKVNATRYELKNFIMGSETLKEEFRHAENQCESMQQKKAETMQKVRDRKNKI